MRDSSCNFCKIISVQWDGGGVVANNTDVLFDKKMQFDGIKKASFQEFMKTSKNCFAVWFDEGRSVTLWQATTFLFAGSNVYYENAKYRKKRSICTAEESIRRARERLGKEQYNLLPIIASILPCGAKLENPSPAR